MEKKDCQEKPATNIHRRFSTFYTGDASTDQLANGGHSGAHFHHLKQLKTQISHQMSFSKTVDHIFSFGGRTYISKQQALRCVVYL